MTPGLRLIETIFGFVLHGQAQGESPSARRHAYRCQLADAEQMWALDAVGVCVEEMSVGLVPPVPTWNKTEERYQMGLLWKSDNRPVSNLMSAEARTNRMMQKLNDEQFQEYDDHLSQLLEDSIIEHAPSSPSEFILPHR